MKKISLITLLCLFAATVSVPFASAVRKKPKQEPIAQLVQKALEKKEKSGEKKKADSGAKKEKSGEKKKADSGAKKEQSGEKKKADSGAKKEQSGEKKPIRIAALQLDTNSSGGQVGGTPVPDSGSSLILLGMGALGIYAARRFRNRK